MKLRPLWRLVLSCVLAGCLVIACGPDGMMSELGQSLHDSLGLTFEPPSLVPNGTAANATPITGRQEVVRGNLWPNGDVDFYSFQAEAGDRIYVALNTQFSAGSSTDSQLTLLDTNGVTVIELDDDNGTYAALSSTIAGATLPTSGTYFIRVNDFTPGTTSQRGYDLYFQLRSGSPTAEVEPNDGPSTATPLPASGWVSGARDPAAASEQDWYALSLQAGDTVFLSLDLDPERDGTVWNGRLGLGLFGDASNQIIVVDDSGTGDVSPNPNRPSEALFMTVRDAGTYYAFVDSASAAVGGPTATYNLNVSVYPYIQKGTSCTTYTSSDVPQTIGPGTGLVSSTITIPGHPRIGDINVGVTLSHALMSDIDAHLRSPAGNDNGLFTDIGAAAVGGQSQMDLVFDDEAALGPVATVLRRYRVRPENNSTAGTASTSGAYRLRRYEGEDAGGTWTLDLRDDTTGANGGTLTAWFIEICEPEPKLACANSAVPLELVTGGDFEGGDAGFTHSGTQDEWELGTPATVATTTANPIAAFSNCNSGVNCWKTDLDNTYDLNSNQDLFSPAISLATSDPPYYLSWFMRHQIETANFDHFFVDIEEAGGAGAVQRAFEWLDPTAISASAGTGNPQENIGGSAGWGLHTVRIDDAFADRTIRVRFHLDSDSAVVFAGVAIDDVSISACPLCGNGSVDPGEECDSGAGNGAATSCCSATCTFVASDTVCRAANGACDAAEACTGASGVCPADLPRPNNDPCDADDDLCTANDSCQAGVCTPGAAVTCDAPAQCKLAGVCNSGSGLCDYADAPNGDACNDGNGCTSSDVCRAGACAGTGTCGGGDADGGGGGGGGGDGDGDGDDGDADGVNDGSSDDDDGGCSATGSPGLGAVGSILAWLASRRRRVTLRRWSDPLGAQP